MLVLAILPPAALALAMGILSPRAAATSGATAAQQPVSLSIDAVADLIAKKPRALHIYDANPKEVYEQGHLPGARWIAFDHVTPDSLPKDRSAILVFYCYNDQCRASHRAATSAIDLGWQKVHVMPAGIRGWQKAGKPVEKG
jgi:rhodanese-related sulfurtransferase